MENNHDDNDKSNNVIDLNDYTKKEDLEDDDNEYYAQLLDNLKDDVRLLISVRVPHINRELADIKAGNKLLMEKLDLVLAKIDGLKS